MRLLLEVAGAPVPLDSRRALAEQGLREGASVLIEMLPPPPPPLPPALPYVLTQSSVLTLDSNPAASPHVAYVGARRAGQKRTPQASTPYPSPTHPPTSPLH